MFLFNKSASSGHKNHLDSRETSCPTDPPRDTKKRTAFGLTNSCTVYGYPSSGGILIKAANVLDLVFLGLSRAQESERDADQAAEDHFCRRLRQCGATWWASEDEYDRVQTGEEKGTAEQRRIVVFGWPSDGVGVWVLRFESRQHVPMGFGRVAFALDMEERIEVMRDYGASFSQDPTQTEELR